MLKIVSACGALLSIPWLELEGTSLELGTSEGAEPPLVPGAGGAAA